MHTYELQTGYSVTTVNAFTTASVWVYHISLHRLITTSICAVIASRVLFFASELFFKKNCSLLSPRVLLLSPREPAS